MERPKVQVEEASLFPLVPGGLRKKKLKRHIWYNHTINHYGKPLKYYLMWQPSNAALWNPPDLCGVLEKQGRKNGEWKPRYFILKGSNLFWFSTPTARTPKGVVPLEGASVHTLRGPMVSSESLSHGAIYQDGAPPVMFGVLMLLDQAYAATPGGRQDLAIGASSPELQALWVKALQAASISRPQLLAKLHQKSNQTASSYGPKHSSRQPSHSGISTATSLDNSYHHPSYSSPEQVHEKQQHRDLQEHHETSVQAGPHARSLSDTGGLSVCSGSPSSRPRESFAFPIPGGPGSSRLSYDAPPPSMREARLSQFNLQQLQRQFEAGQDGRDASPSMAAAVLEGEREHSGYAHTRRATSRSPYRARPRSATPPRSRAIEPAHSTLSGPPAVCPSTEHVAPPYGPATGSGGKDQGRYPLRQMVRNLTGKVVGRITPERRRAGTPERLACGGAGVYEVPYDGRGGAVGPSAGTWGQGHARAISPAAAAGTVGGRLVHGIMGNWAGEEEAPHGRPTRKQQQQQQQQQQQHRRTPPASPHRSGRSARSPGPAHSHYGHPDMGGGSSAQRHKAAASSAAVGDGGSAAASPANSVTGLPLRRTPSPSAHSCAAPPSSAGRSQPGTPPHPLAPPLSGSSTPTRSPTHAAGALASPSASTCVPPPPSIDDLDQLSRQLRRAFMGLGGSSGSGVVQQSSRGSDAGNSCVGASGGELASSRLTQQLPHAGVAAEDAHGLTPHDELAAVQQQVSVAAQLLRSQADRLQNALGLSTLATAGAHVPSQHAQPSKAPSEIKAAPSSGALQAASGSATPASARSAAASQQLQPNSAAQLEAEGGPAAAQGSNTRQRADTVFFINQFQALQASLAEVAVAAAGAQQQQQQQQVPSGRPRGSMVQPRASMQAVHGPLQHYLSSVQQQLTKLQAHRASVEHDEAASLGSAMEAVQQALAALNGGVIGGGSGAGGGSGTGSPAPVPQQSRGPSRMGSSADASRMHVQPASPTSRSAAPSRLGSGSLPAGFAAGDDGSAPSRATSAVGLGSSAAGGMSPRPGEGGGSRANSIRQAASDLRSQTFQHSPELCALNQAQQQQVYASVHQQTLIDHHHQQQQQNAYSRPASTADMAFDHASHSRQPSTVSISGNRAPTYSRQPSTMSMPSDPAVAQSRQPSTMSMLSDPPAAQSRQPSTVNMATNPAAAYSRQPSTMSMPSDLAAAQSRQPSTVNTATNPAAAYSRQPSTMSILSDPPAAQSRQPSTVSMATNPAADYNRQPSTMSMANNSAAVYSHQSSTMGMARNHAAHSHQLSTLSNTASPQSSMLPLPRLQDQAQPIVQHPASAKPSAAMPNHDGPASSPSIASVQPTVRQTHTSPRASGAGRPSILSPPSAFIGSSPRTISSPVAIQAQQQQQLAQQPVATGPFYPRTASMPAPSQRVQQLQQQPRARYSSTDWC